MVMSPRTREWNEKMNEPLKIPQARVLYALMPIYPDDPPGEWPLITRNELCHRAGFTTLSGTVTRVLNGIRPGNKTTGKPHPGLIERGLMECVIVEVEGVKEKNYKITRTGIKAMQEFMIAGRTLPNVRPRGICINDRFIKE